MKDIYFENKFVESIIYNNEILKQDNLEEKLDINFLKYLNQYLKINETEKTIDSKVKDRLYEIIRYIRFNMNQNSREEYNKELNKAIEMINKMPQANRIKFYSNQLKNRASDGSLDSETIDAATDPRIQELICYSICYDYQVLCDLIKSPNEYKKEMEKYIGNEYGWFICSVKGMNYENPKLFDDKNVRENIRATNLYNKLQGFLTKTQERGIKEIETFLKR